jgi:hypothetical protein
MGEELIIVEPLGNESSHIRSVDKAKTMETNSQRSGREVEMSLDEKIWRLRLQFKRTILESSFQATAILAYRATEAHRDVGCEN